MSDKLSPPENFSVKAGDCQALMRWSEREGADGYLLRFYRGGKCIKRRYAKRSGKIILGFANGEEYAVSVTSFCLDGGKEIFGEESGLVAFTPISEVLKAQQAICLDAGDSAEIKCEYRNTVPSAFFSSSDENVATVDNSGRITAVNNGKAQIYTRYGDNTAVTEVYVGRGNRNDRRAVLLFGGDIMCALNHQRIAKKYLYDFAGCFDGIKDILRKADFSAAVLETACFDGAVYENECKRLDKGAPNCNSPSAFLDALTDFSALITANNHNLDTGIKGLTYTVENMRARGIDNIGTLGDSPVIINVKGISVGIVAANLISNGQELRLSQSERLDAAGIYDAEDFAKKIALAKERGAEYVIAYMHWGTMNSSIVRQNQRDAAKAAADAGADIIIGSHPHVMQSFEPVRAADGRVVPCAYSLGNLFTSMNEQEENREGALLRLTLSESKDGISAHICFIPTICTDTDRGVRIDPALPVINARYYDGLKRIKASLGALAEIGEPKPKILLNGSAVLRNTFNDGEFNTDGAGLIISQLAAVGEGMPCAEGSRRVRLEVEKSLDSYIDSTKPDYIMIDLYTAAGVSCYKLGDEYYTASQGFKASEFYKAHESELKLVRQPFDEEFIRRRLKMYADMLLKRFSPERIILLRLSFSDTAVTHGRLRATASHEGLNRRIRKLEDIFISYAEPVVIDTAGRYFSDCSKDNQPSSLERYFYLDVKNTLRRILSGERRKYYNETDPHTWIARIAEYYDSMTARAWQDRLLTRSAADIMIRYTSKEFVLRHAERLIKLKAMAGAELSRVSELFDDEEFSRAAKAVYLLSNGDIRGRYEDYSIVFSHKLNAIKLMLPVLSEYTGIKIDADTAEVAFRLKDEPEKLREYFAKIGRVRADIWGSCVTRETVNRCGGRIEVGRYIFKQPQVLAYEPPIPYRLPSNADKYCQNAWRRRTAQEAFAHKGTELLEQSGGDWLFVDFYDLICTMCELEGGLFETDDFIRRCGFFTDIADRVKDTYLFNSRSEEQCRQGMERYAAFCKEHYGKNIILILVDPKDTYIDLDNKVRKLPEDKEFIRKREFIRSYEQQFITLTDCAVIDIARYYYSDDKFALGGAHIAHYEEEFYTDAGRGMLDIISGKTRYYSNENKEYIAKRNARLL